MNTDHDNSPAFEGNHERILKEDFPFAQLDHWDDPKPPAPQATPMDVIRLKEAIEILVGYSRFFNRGYNDQIIRRVKLVSFLVESFAPGGRDGPQTQRELAESLGLSAGRITQELNALKAEIASVVEPNSQVEN